MPLCVCLRVIFVYCTVLGCGFGFKGMETAAIVLHLLMETDKLLKLTATAMQGLLFLFTLLFSQLFCITIMYVVANL